jgi:predicted Zn-ribbon and HTH transcriptional regulator
VGGPARGHRFDFADIVRAHRAELEVTLALSREQKRVLTDIGQCRTAALGGHLDQCAACGYEHPSYNSCRNRHCPKCQALAQEKWIAEQRARMLEGRYFHVVFTLPSELRPLAAFSPRIVYDALFRVAGRILLELGESRLRATIGATLILHTWTRALAFHPHVHAIATGGGLALDGTRSIAGSRRFLFPKDVMALLLRGKMIDALREAHAQNAFAGFDDFLDPEGFTRLIRKLWNLKWIVYAKPTFASGHYVLQYLGRYTHRVALSNGRFLDVTPDHVTFRTKGDGTETLTPVELLRRFVRHVLPDGFHKIRHVGLHASADKRSRARELMGASNAVVEKKGYRERLLDTTGRDVSLCPRCGAPLHALPLPTARGPPAEAA